MFDNLTSRLSGVIKTLRGEARLTENNIQEALREVRMALLEADVALPVVKEFIARIKEKAVGKEVIGSLSPGQALVGVVHQEIIALMGAKRPISIFLPFHLRSFSWRACKVRARPPAAGSSRNG